MLYGWTMDVDLFSSVFFSSLHKIPCKIRKPNAKRVKVFIKGENTHRHIHTNIQSNHMERVWYNRIFIHAFINEMLFLCIFTSRAQQHTFQQRKYLLSFKWWPDVINRILHFVFHKQSHNLTLVTFPPMMMIHLSK